MMEKWKKGKVEVNIFMDRGTHLKLKVKLMKEGNISINEWGNREADEYLEEGVLGELKRNYNPDKKGKVRVVIFLDPKKHSALKIKLLEEGGYSLIEWGNMAANKYLK